MSKNDHNARNTSCRSIDRVKINPDVYLYGFLLGAFGGGVGHTLVFLLLEFFWVPPFKPQESFGQFGFFTGYIAFWGSLCGLSLVLIPCTRLIGWLILFGLISMIAGIPISDELMTTAGAAMIVVWIALNLVFWKNLD